MTKKLVPIRSTQHVIREISAAPLSNKLERVHSLSRYIVDSGFRPKDGLPEEHAIHGSIPVRRKCLVVEIGPEDTKFFEIHRVTSERVSFPVDSGIFTSVTENSSELVVTTESTDKVKAWTIICNSEPFKNLEVMKYIQQSEAMFGRKAEKLTRDTKQFITFLEEVDKNTWVYSAVVRDLAKKLRHNHSPEYIDALLKQLGNAGAAFRQLEGLLMESLLEAQPAVRR